MPWIEHDGKLYNLDFVGYIYKTGKNGIYLCAHGDSTELIFRSESERDVFFALDIKNKVLDGRADPV